MDNEPTLKIDKWGNKRWYLNDKRHRIDGPAVDRADGYKEWHLNGKKHRIDGPAIEWVNGRKSWFLHNAHYSFDKWLELTDYISEEEKVMIKLTYG
jgi:hypothetical protein